MSTHTSSAEIHVEARGAHWISWITRGGETTPHGAVVLVAASEKEARDRARDWAAQTAY